MSDTEIVGVPEHFEMSRILVLADTPNLFRRATAKYGPTFRPDYKVFRSRLVAVGTLQAEALVNGGVPTSFIESMKKLGWGVTFSRAEDTDEMLIARAVLRHRFYDCVVIASGDGKNVELIKLLKTVGKYAVVAGIPGSINRELYEVADQIVDFPVRSMSAEFAAA